MINKKYINGNYIVSIDRPNTIFESRKYTSLRFNENLDPSFPDSIDLKITNKCSWGCPFCHESSNPKGKDFDLDKTIKMLEKLPDYPIEIAIGGGNIFDCFDKFRELYTYIEGRGMLPRFTINSKDLFDQDKYNKLLSLCESTKPIIGISVST
jgi:MoaA/NifB/PqqE/SkfB family radical SAM enzyme